MRSVALKRNVLLRIRPWMVCLILATAACTPEASVDYQDVSLVSVKQLDYEEKLSQASATSTASLLSLSEDAPDRYECDLWFRVESLYNDSKDPASRRASFAHQYDYRRVRLMTNL